MSDSLGSTSSSGSLLGARHIYSFTQLTSFRECPYSFYLQKIERNPDTVSNAFASQGTLIHDLLDQWAKGILTIDELPVEYDRRYPNEVVEEWPKMLAKKGYAEKAFQIGHDYFVNFDGFKGFKIISTEEKFRVNIAGRPFVGVVDMMMEDEGTGELIIVDHKSKSLAAFKKAEDEMYRQQLLYSCYAKEKFGKFPDRLMFNLFKEGGVKMERLFTQQEYNEAMKWASETIDLMESYDIMDYFQTKEVNPDHPDFFCTELCSCRKICPNGQAKPKWKRK